MNDQITMTLNADRLLLQALQEDITSEDITTNSVMRGPAKGEVELICKQDGIIAGLLVFQRVFSLLDSQTTCTFFCKDGDRVQKGQRMAIVTGDIRAVRRTGSFEFPSADEWNCHLYQICSRTFKGK